MKHSRNVLKVFTALLFSALVGLVFASGGWIIGLKPLWSGLVGVGVSLIPTNSGVLGFKIGTLLTGVGVETKIDLQFLPEKIFYVAATQLTSFKCEVHGEGVLTDLDASGLTALGVHRVVGQVANGYIIPLADGIMPGLNVKLTFMNSAAQTPDIWALGNNTGTTFIRTNKATVLLNNNTDFSDFGALFLPSFAAGDKATILYEDTTSHIYERDELKAESGLIQYVTQYQIDNLDFKIVKVNLLVAATQTIYLTDFKRPA